MIQNSNGGFRGMVSSEYNDRDYHLVQLPPHCKASICMLIKKQKIEYKRRIGQREENKREINEAEERRQEDCRIAQF